MRSSPPVSFRSWPRYSEPAFTLSAGEDGSSGPERFCSTHCHVPGITCITPRAFADETMPLLKPLSCHATADASEPDTPCCAAIELISLELVWPGAAYGAACGTRCGGLDVVPAAGAPVGSFSAVP